MSVAALVAVIEDEDHLAQGLLFNLQAEGYRTHHEADGDAALAWLLVAARSDDPPAAVLLDAMLPGRDGFAIVRGLREAGLFTPVLMLTARGRSEDVVDGFTAGADDYLAKPFDLNVLFARLAALLRRTRWQASATPTQGERLELNGRTIDFDALEIVTPERTVHLTLMEADLLRYLVEHPERVVPRKELLENVWRVKEDTDTRAIDNFIVRLRRYLETDPARPRHLTTVRGVGYRFTVKGPDQA